MPMTILQKGKHQIHPLFVTCFREAIIFPQTGRCTISLRKSGWNCIRILRILKWKQNAEDVLDAAEIFYNKSETWIESEKLYEVLYTFEMLADGEGARKTGNKMKEAGNVYEEK